MIVDVQDTTREEIGQHGIEVFNKGDVKGIKHSTRSRIPEAICLGMWSIANQNTRDRPLKELRVVCHDQGERFAANFPQVRQGR